MQCPHCQGAIQDDPRLGGKVVACPYCKQSFSVPFDFAQLDAPEPVQYAEREHDPFGDSDDSRTVHVHYHNEVGGISNPGLAAVMSFFCLGLGQIYNGEIGKGIALMFGWLVMFSCLGFGSLVLAATPLSLAGGLLLVPLVCLIGLAVWIWNIVDAYQTADRKNRLPRRRYRR